MEENEILTETPVAAGVETDILDTPEIAVPPKEADAHQGIISGVELTTFQSGATAIKVNLQSTNNPNVTDKKNIFLPEQFVENIYVTEAEMDDSVPEGKKMSPKDQLGRAKQDIYGAKRVDKKTKVETRFGGLIPLAIAPGRTSADAATAALGSVRKPTTLAEFVAVLNALLAGVEVVFRRRPQRDDPQFLEVDGIYEPEVVNDAKRSAKLFTDRTLAWAPDGE